MAKPVLDIRGLRKSFGALQATDDVSLTLMPGEIHALIGPNGAGKSTLIAQITGDLRPDAGQIRFLGQPIDRVDAAGRARLGLARSFQVSQVIADFSALENVVLAEQGASGRSFGFWRPVLRDRSLTVPARAHLAAVGLQDRETIAAGALSHGERRRLEIAMALALHPRALLLDEPMAGAGTEGAGQLVSLLSGLRAQVPILLIEHDMDAVFALADRISVLVAGRIIASGPVEVIRNDPAVRQSYLGDPA